MYRISTSIGPLRARLLMVGVVLGILSLLLPATPMLASQTATCHDTTTHMSSSSERGMIAKAECLQPRTQSNSDLLSAAPIALDGYRFTGDRKLIFVNNPEQLVVNYQAPDGVVYSDLADPTLGGKSILRQDIATGKYRNIFEHKNDTGDTIGYGVQIYNPGSEALIVTIEGQGFTASSDYAAAFVQLLNNPTSQTISVAGQSTEWLMLEQNSISQGSFFSGAVDFTISGPATINNMAFRSFSSLTSWEYMGWIRRAQNGFDNNEDRLYKGLSTQTDTVSLPLNVTIAEDTPDGDLTFSYPRYVNNGSDVFVPSSEQVTLPYWMTHAVPSRDNPDNGWYAISSDMATFTTPNIPSDEVIDPNRLYPDHTVAQPNLGNWGVMYLASGTVQNNSLQTKEITFKIAAAAGDVYIAYWNGSQWESAKIPGGSTLEYSSVTVEAGQSQPIDARYIVGMPSNSRLKNSVAVSTP